MLEQNASAKVLVKVVSETDTHGNVTPLSLIWEDGRVFKIDRVLDKRQAVALKAGGCGIRYTCRIRNKPVYLFYDEPCWFMERKLQ
jgi:hypothetical protein